MARSSDFAICFFICPSRYSSDILYSWDGLLTREEFAALWYVLFI